MATYDTTGVDFRTQATSYVPVQHGDRRVEPEELGVQVRPRLPVAAGVLSRDLDARLARRVPRLELAVHLFY